MKSTQCIIGSCVKQIKHARDVVSAWDVPAGNEHGDSHREYGQLQGAARAGRLDTASQGKYWQLHGYNRTW